MFRALIPLVALLLAAAPARADSLTARFGASDAGKKLDGLGVQLLWAAPFEGDEVLVAYYVPFQGAMSDWDEETRVDLYRRQGDAFEREQFVTRAGDAVPGKLAAWSTPDLDGDGRAELVLISRPHLPGHKVKSIIYARGGGARFKPIWKRDDVSAALRLDGSRLDYTFEDRTAGWSRMFERHVLKGGQFVRLEGPSGDSAVWTRAN